MKFVMALSINFFPDFPYILTNSIMRSAIVKILAKVRSNQLENESRSNFQLCGDDRRIV
jgi:hypothetical protein